MQQIHFSAILKNAQSRIESIEDYTLEIQRKKENVSADEQATLQQTLSQMDAIQAQIFSMWNERKTALVNQIHQFYKKKTQ